MTNREEKKKMAAKTISIVHHGVSLGQIVQALIRTAYDWARENPVPKKRDLSARKRALRNRLESVLVDLRKQFADHQNITKSTESFPWDKKLRKIIATILRTFRQRFFYVEKHYRGREYYCRPEDVLANLHDGLEAACRQWLK